MTINLTPVFVVWTLFWGALALLLTSSTLFWVAVIPWLAAFGFAFISIALGVSAMVLAWFMGNPIEVTNKRTGRTHIVRRK